MNCSKGDVVLLPIPFTNLESRKVRPAVVMGRFAASGDLIVVPITSRFGEAVVALDKWREAGLNVPSGFEPHIATIEGRLAIKRIGRLEAEDLAAVDRLARSWLQL